MAHYAKVLDGKVLKVIVAEQEFFNSFVDDSPGEWIQTSYNTCGNVHKLGGTPLRKNFASVGGCYDREGDFFHDTQPYASWTLNRTTGLWEPPIVYPTNGLNYLWDEELYQSDNTQGWVEVTND